MGHFTFEEHIKLFFSGHIHFLPDMSGLVLSDILHVVDMSGMSGRDRRTEATVRPSARHLLPHQ